MKSNLAFGVYCVALTGGVILAMPDVAWLRPLGLLVIFAAWALFRDEERIVDWLLWLGSAAFAAVGIAFLNLTAPLHDVLGNIRPSMESALNLVGIWLLCMYQKFRWWMSLTTEGREVGDTVFVQS
jgi:hypothetical protein